MSKKHPTALRGLKIKSVSVVDQGANQHAHIKLAKRADEQNEQQPEGPVESDEALFARLAKALSRLLHIAPSADVEKDAKTFSDLDNAAQYEDRLWRIISALTDSIRSIATDDDMTGQQKSDMIVESTNQAMQAIKTDVAGIFGGTIAKADEESPAQEPSSEEPAGNTEPETTNSGEQTVSVPEPTGTAADEQQQKGATDMKFNTDAMTTEERAQLEDLQKRFGVEEADHTQEPSASGTEESADTGNDGDIYKGLHPAIKAELESLRKFREESEDRELMEVAKRYTILGKKPEELVPTLKSLRSAGGTAYADMIALLDANVAAVEKSGVFAEIGKRGNGGDISGDAWGKIEAAAQEIAKSDRNVTMSQAIEKACEQHPELVADYEKSRK